MQRISRLVAVAAMALLAAAQAGSQAGLQEKTSPLDRMRALAGEWEGTASSSNAAARVTYKVVSGGSAVMEIIEPQGEENMVTIYHEDNGRLLMTHYCAAGNQPRMTAPAPAADARQIVFKLQDVTNLASASSGHMVGLVLTFVDKDHITQEWTWREKGKADMTEKFTLTRRK